MWLLDQVVKAVGGTVLQTEKDGFTTISTDSRTVGEGELFIPITGPNFDGHLFCGDAYERSRGGCLCEKSREEVWHTLKGTVILVEDTTQALLDLARYHLRHKETTCIAITGSNGKTTTKEVLVSMITGFASVHYNEKNYNNLIGVSKSILAMDGNPRYAVFELGTNMPGEIGKLARTTNPHLSLITNVNPSHLEGLKTLEGVLEEKLDLFRLTQEGGRIFVNADDPSIMPRIKDFARTSLTYGIDHDASFHLKIVRDMGWEGMEILIDTPDGAFPARTHLLGKHNLYNVLAAAAIASAIGVEKGHIADTVERFASYNMRFKPVRTRSGAMVIDDTYNANPASMEWAVRTLLALPAENRKIAILGDMRELGEKSADYHAELGRFLKSTDISFVALIGEEMGRVYAELGNERARLFRGKDDLMAYMKGWAKEGDTILIKGSRASKMEEIVEALK